jgi:outer membrane protein assembly factor BamA
MRRWTVLLFLAALVLSARVAPAQETASDVQPPVVEEETAAAEDGPADAVAPDLGVENEALMGKTVREIYLDLPPTIAARSIRRHLKLAEGKPFTRRRCRRTIHTLYYRGDVANVVIKASPNDDGTVFVKITVEPLLSYRDFFISGNSRFNEDDIRRILRMERGREYRDTDEATFTDRLENAYADIGYAAARTTFRFKIDKEESKVDLFLAIREGPRYKMRFLDLTGDFGLPVETITRKVGWRLYRTAKAETVEDGVKRLKRYYRKRGYLEAKVEDPEYRYDHVHRQLDVGLHVEAGKRVVVEYDPKVFSWIERTWTVDRALELTKQRKVNRWVVRELEGKLKKYLQSKGYLDAQVVVEYDENDERRLIRFSALPDGRWKIGKIRFDGASFFSQKELRQILEAPRRYEAGEFDKALTTGTASWGCRSRG